MTRAWPFLILALAAALRWFDLGSEGLWVDEAYTVELVRASFGTILERLRYDDAPPLFYFAEKGVLALLGISEGAVRLLPALAGFGAVVQSWLLVRRYRPNAASIALLLAASSSLLVFYARQARSYGVLHLFCVLLLDATLRLAERPTRKRLVYFLGIALGALYTHNISIGLLFAAVLLLAPKLRDRSTRALLTSGGVVGVVLSIPWFLRVSEQMAQQAEFNAWMAAWWKERPLALAPLYSFAAFVNGAAPSIHPPVVLPGLDRLWLPLSWPLWLFAGASLLYTLRRSIREQETGLERASLVFAIVPLCALTVASFIGEPSYVVGRTDTQVLPAFLVAVALGWNALPSATLRRIGLVLWVTLGLVALWPTFDESAPGRKGSDRELGRRLASMLRPGDALVYPSLAEPSLAYYLDRFGAPKKLAYFEGFPGHIDRNPGAAYAPTLDSLASWRGEALRLRGRWEDEGVERVVVLAIRDFGPKLRRIPLWPPRPATPPSQRRTVNARDVAYPMNLLLAHLVGLAPVSCFLEYRQDWVGGERIVLLVPRSAWVPVDSLPAFEVER